MSVSDEILMAYADNMLDADQRTAVEAALANSEAVRQRLVAFAVTGQPIHRIYAPILDQPPPDRLIETLRSAPAARTGNRPRAAWPQRLAELVGLGGTPMHWGMALASAGLVAVAGTSVWLTARPAVSPVITAADFLHEKAGDRVAVGPLAVALERTPSRAQAPVALRAGHEFELRPMLTFAARGGGFCRQYTLSGHGLRFEGLACRNPDGSWRVPALLTAQGPTETKPDSAGGVRPAANPDHPQIEAAVDQLIDGDALGADNEAQLISKGWKPGGNK